MRSNRLICLKWKFLPLLIYNSATKTDRQTDVFPFVTAKLFLTFWRNEFQFFPSVCLRYNVRACMHVEATIFKRRSITFWLIRAVLPIWGMFHGES